MYNFRISNRQFASFFVYLQTLKQTMEIAIFLGNKGNIYFDGSNNLYGLFGVTGISSITEFKWQHDVNAFSSSS